MPISHVSKILLILFSYIATTMIGTSINTSLQIKEVLLKIFNDPLDPKNIIVRTSWQQVLTSWASFVYLGYRLQSHRSLSNSTNESYKVKYVKMLLKKGNPMNFIPLQSDYNKASFILILVKHTYVIARMWQREWKVKQQTNPHEPPTWKKKKKPS